MKAYEVARTKMVQDMSVRTLTNLVSNFEQSDYVLKIDMKGHHERRWIVLNDDVWGSQLRDYVRTESVQKGQKNMTVKKFRTFVNDVIIPEVIKKGDEKSLSKKIQQNGIAESTARFWLHYMGCYFKQGRKDIYYDGHEREDVVEYRAKFIPRFLDYFNDPSIILVIQDESIYRPNEHNNFYWQIDRPGEAINTVLRNKSLGSGTMVSGFITIFGFVGLTDEEMAEVNARRAAKNEPPITMAIRVTNDEVDGLLGDENALTFSYHLFEYGKQRGGYWDGEKMLAQTLDVLSMLEYKFPGKTFVFLFDWSSGHDKKPVDSVILGNMRLKWGGKQPLMRPSTILEDYASPDPDIYRILKKGEPQHFIFQENDPPPFYELTAQDYVGKPKGVKQIAYERGLWRDGMVLRDNNNPERSLFHVLQKCPDFQQFVKSILQEEIEKSGHVCDFLPKFHCELSPIERVWAKSKRYVRDYADDTRQTMTKNVKKSFLLDNLPSETVIRFFGKSMDYAVAYHKGDSVVSAIMAVKKKSHRAVLPSECN